MFKTMRDEQLKPLLPLPVLPAGEDEYGTWTFPDELLHLFVENGVESGVLFALYRIGANINSVRLNHQTAQTPLKLAARGGNATMVELLIKHGANIELMTLDNTAFILAGRYGREATLRILGEEGMR